MAPSSTTMPNERPYKCSTCQLCFVRRHHLNRHMKMHTGEKRYRCPCGETFFRSDILVRHLRRCDIGRETDAQIAERAREKKTRTKRACDLCARAKSRCDGQEPCGYCSHHSFQCRYTRDPPVDLYSSYRIDHAMWSADGSGLKFSGTEFLDIGSTSSTTSGDFYGDLNDNSLGQSEPISVDCDISDSHWTELSAAAVLQPIQDPDWISNIDLDTMLMDFNFLMDSAPQSLKTSSAALMTLQDTLTSKEVMDYQHYRPTPPHGFLYERMDPVQAKCNEVKKLLQGSEPLVAQSMINKYITRETILHCCHNYGQNFQRHFPVVHSPSFNLSQTPTLLLLAIIVAGAGFERRLLPSAFINCLAMRLLLIIDTQQLNMDIPPTLATIQASILTCSTLVCSRSETACNFVSNYFRRNYLMIQQMGILGVDSPDYKTFTEETFDWQKWIEQESLRRSACEIFCQDVAGCIFQGSSPTISPLNFHVQLPCYESCWEAATASECLQILQNMPSQIRLSTAIQYLRAPSAQNVPLFEASAFGMFVLIKGLHYFVFQATKYETEFPQDTHIPQPPVHPSASQTNVISDPTCCLQQDLKGSRVAVLADQAATKEGGSLNLKKINLSLNAWRSTWDLRLFRELWCENASFFNDPLPFWWLAKLYIFLHFNATSIGQDSEFATPRAERGSGNSLLLVQEKIIGWFSRFGRQYHMLAKVLIMEAQDSNNNDSG